MDNDLFRNTLATNGLSAGRPNRSRKPKRPIAFFLIIISAYLIYHFKRVMWNSRERVIWFSLASHHRCDHPGGLSALAFNFLAMEFGLQLAYLEVFLGSLGGVLGLIYVLKKHHIPVRGLPD